jgi:hypothetical protein
VIKLEAEVQDLRCQLFAQSSLTGDPEAFAEAEAAMNPDNNQTSTPSIFS